LPHPRITPLDAIIAGAYFIFALALGAWFGRKKIKTGDDFFLAEREATWPLIGASLFSANVSSQQFVGQAGLAFTLGLAAGGFQLVGAVCFMLLAVFFIDVYLGLKLTTSPQFFERRFGSGSRLFVAGINVLMIIAANLTVALYAGATVLADLAGWHHPAQFLLAIGCIAAGAGACTLFGGLRSVLWFDLVQAFVLVGGGVVTLCCAISRAGGVHALAGLRDGHGRSLWSVIQPWSHPFGWLPLVTGAIVLGVHGHCTDQDYVQRALAAKSVLHSKLGALFAAFLKIVALFIIVMPGVVAVKLLPAGTPADRVYVGLVTGFVPSGLAGLVLAGLMAAILGSMAAGLSAVSSLLTYDFVLRFSPALSEARKVLTGRLLIAAVLAVCVGAAPMIARYNGLFTYLVQIWSLLAPGVFVCVVAGVFTRWASNRGAVAALAVGSVVGLMGFVTLNLPALYVRLPLYLRNPLNLGFLITLLCAAVMALFSQRQEGGANGAAAALVRRASATRTMTAGENRIYRLTLATLVILWLAVVLIFSPVGIGATRPPPAARAQTTEISRAAAP
jgi:SSS family solute:Na+ symporter